MEFHYRVSCDTEEGHLLPEELVNAILGWNQKQNLKLYGFLSCGFETTEHLKPPCRFTVESFNYVINLELEVGQKDVVGALDGLCNYLQRILNLTKTPTYSCF